MRRVLPLACLALLAVLAAGCRGSRRPPSPSEVAEVPASSRGRVVLLALDGFDLTAVERWVAEGRLPHFARLREAYGFSSLRTTEPPSCEAAWTTFVTGLPPADSGVFGPLRLDPDTYRTRPGTIELDLEVAPPRVTTRRSGTAFWTRLAQAGRRVRVLWAPYELPPERAPGAEVLAGAGTPDLAGRPGRGTLLGAAFPEGVRDMPVADRVRLLPSAVGWSARLPGPPWPGTGGRLELPVDVRRGADPTRLAVTVPGYETELPPGYWSARMPATFHGGGDAVVEALARFLVIDAGDLPLLLAAPLEVSPVAPWYPLSEPPGWAAELAARYGRLPTVGTPGDLAALVAGLQAEESYLADLADDFAARSKVLLGELDRGGFDLLVAFVPTVERVALGLQRLADPEHPAWDEARSLAAAPGFGNVRLCDAVLAAYAFVDDLAGQVAARLGPDDVLLVLSDHGLRPFRRAVHLNAWLVRQGLLVLRSRDPFAAATRSSDHVPDLSEVDWSRSQAYAAGGSFVQLNLEGRERDGLVEPGERRAQVLGRLEDKLLAWRDDRAGGARVVQRVLVRGRDLRGRREDVLPDLFVVFAEPYAVSEQTVAGLVPDEELEPNRTVVGVEHASGDAGALRGFFLSTRPLVQGDPALGDVGATLLGHFGVPAAHGRGRDLWRP
ncbi:MAG: alkaline phosphatase family protein [Deltaproteobacteria bacterium]|nr:alkaline phosphatase family protein [Deltaproteobacteria bacterium]